MQKAASEGFVNPKSSESLAKNLKEMDQSVKQMLKLIEEDGDSLTNNSDVYHLKRPELIAHIEEFCSMYRSLAERYDQMPGDLDKGTPSVFQLLGSGNSEQGSPLLTPDDKLSLHKSGCRQVVGMDMSPGSGAGSSEPSLKEGSESFSLSSSDSESDSFNSSINNYLNSPMNIDGKEQKMLNMAAELPSMKMTLGASEEDNAGSMLKEAKYGNHEELLSRYEEELKVSKLKLQLSEEVARLKSELEKNESIVQHEMDMRAQLEAAQRNICMKEAELEDEKIQVLQMQEQIALLETQVLNSNVKMGRLMEELEVTRERLKDSGEEIEKLKWEVKSKISEGTQELQCQLDWAREDIAMLEAKLDSERRQVLELQESIVKYQADVSDHDREVKELEAALCDAHENFSKEKEQLHSEIVSLSEKHMLLDAKLNEWELRSKSLEDKLRQCELEKLEMKGSSDAIEFALHGEIKGLKVELDERGRHVESLNKNLDGLKLKYDMLMAEKDEANAKIHKLIAEISSRDDQIQQMEEHLRRLRVEHVDVVAGSESVRKLADELRLKVEELEREVDRQRLAISDGAEEKREVIRQLCFSLEYYRSGYQELRQAFIRNKRHAVMAS